MGATPKYEWFINQIKNNRVLYLNKKKSIAWSSAIRGQFPVGSKLRNTLDSFMLSKNMANIKTELDLEAEQAKWPTMYQLGAAVKNQMSEIRKKYEGTDQWMKAPNGTDTKLTEEQWLTVRTPAFKEWFGNWENDPENSSKVVDENGEPLVVYHGTNRSLLSSKFSEFNGNGKAIWHTENKEYAKNYSKKDKKISWVFKSDGISTEIRIYRIMIVQLFVRIPVSSNATALFVILNKQ